MILDQPMKINLTLLSTITWNTPLTPKTGRSIRNLIATSGRLRQRQRRNDESKRDRRRKPNRMRLQTRSRNSAKAWSTQLQILHRELLSQYPLQIHLNVKEYAYSVFMKFERSADLRLVLGIMNNVMKINPRGAFVFG